MADEGGASAREFFADLTGRLRELAAADAQRTELTGTGSARDGRVRVVVDAEGTVTETRFSVDIGDLNHAEIAKAVTAAAAAAARDLANRRAKLFAPFAEGPFQLPAPSTVLDRLPDLSESVLERRGVWKPMMSGLGPADRGTTFDGSPELPATARKQNGTDVDSWVANRGDQRGSRIRDDSW